jgi:hypothetical protein
MAAYIVAAAAMLFAASTALTLIHFVSHLDSPTPDVAPEASSVEPAAAA